MKQRVCHGYKGVVERFRAICMALAAIATVNLVYAQAADPLADLTAFLCNIYATLTSTFGIAASLVVLAIGCLLWAIGARGALSRIGQGVIAITALVSLPTLFFTLFPGAVNAC